MTPPLVPDKHDPRSVGVLTWAVHGGNQVDAGTGAIRTPLTMANSYRLPEDPAAMDWSATDQLTYTRSGGVNQQALERKLAALD